MAAGDTGMYRKERSVPLKSSSSALYNNLSVLPLRDKQLTYFAAVHGSTVSLASASADGLSVSHRQLQAKEGGLAVSASIVTQASWCVLPSRVLLVLTSQKGIQMYESDGSIMVYWHALDVLEPPSAQAVFARGIAAASGRFICVGTSSGLVLVFDIPSKGTNITLSEVLQEHHDSITDIASEVGENPVWSPRHCAQLLSQPYSRVAKCQSSQLDPSFLGNWKPVCQPFLFPMCFPVRETQS